MLRRQSVVAIVATLGFVAAAACDIAGLWAQPPRPARPERAAAKSRPFSPARLTRVFRASDKDGRYEQARNKELDNIERLHRDDPAVAPALWRVIEPFLNDRQVPESLLRAIRLFGLLDEDDTAPQVASLLSAADPREVPRWLPSHWPDGCSSACHRRSGESCRAP